MTFDIVRTSGLFPPIHVLNSFFKCGIDDADSEITLNWEPFTLNQAEFDRFYESCRSLFGELKIDGFGFDEYGDWFSAVAIQNTNS